MIITCPNCNRQYSVDDSRIPVGGATGRCSGCGHRFRIDPSQCSGEIECPKCLTRQPRGEECKGCGVIFDKIPAKPHALESRGAGTEEGMQDPVSLSPETASEATEKSLQKVAFDDAGSPSREAGFALGAAIRFGWTKAKEKLSFFIGFLIVGGILITVPGVLVDLAAQHAPTITKVLFRIVAVVLESAVSMGFIKVCLKIHDAEKPELSDLLECLPLFFKYFLATLLYGIIVLGGFILLIVPGIVWSVKFVFYGCFIVDKGRGPLEALNSSSAITQGSKLDIFLLGICLAGINLLGVLALLVGLFVTIPLSMLAFVYAFRRLQAKLQAS